MEWVELIVMVFVSGLIVGGLARLVVPGRETLGLLGTALAGIAGSVVGGLVGRLLFGQLEWWVGLLFAVAGAVLFVAPFSMRRARRSTV